MRRARKYIAYLLILALPLSSWASAGVPCGQDGNDPSEVAIAVVDAHAHHHDAAAGTIMVDANPSVDHSQHKNPASDETSADSDCTCCDGCEAMCVMSSCSPVAMATSGDLLAFTGRDSHYPQADAFRVGPSRHVLFRPPILSV